MSEAAKPFNEGERMSYEASSEGRLLYEGIFEGEMISFYFHIENEWFLCETKVNGKSAKMAGNLKKNNHGSYICSPIWGVQPFSEDDQWVNTKGEEQKTFDLSKNEIYFEHAKLERK